MTISSYVRAGASCLPIVGPFVALYNASEVARELPSFLELQFMQVRASSAHTQAVLATWQDQPNGIDSAVFTAITQITEVRSIYFPVIQKGRLYAICGIAGNVLSIATMVGCIAFGILTAAQGVIPIIAFTFQVGVLRINLHQHNENINENIIAFGTA